MFERQKLEFLIKGTMVNGLFQILELKLLQILVKTHRGLKEFVFSDFRSAVVPYDSWSSNQLEILQYLY